MLFENHYNNGLLLLSYLLVAADGRKDHSEFQALVKICEKENIPEEKLWQFVDYAHVLTFNVRFTNFAFSFNFPKSFPQMVTWPIFL